jgi:hypothetical protein
MGSQPQKTQKPQKIFLHTLSCREFYADHFGKKTFFISSMSDGTGVKILKKVTEFEPFYIFFIINLAPSSVDEMKKVFHQNDQHNNLYKIGYVKIFSETFVFLWLTSHGSTQISME